MPHLLLDLGVDALANLEDLQLAGEQGQDFAQALEHVDALEHVLLLGRLDVEVADDEVRDLTRVGDAVEQRRGLTRQLRHQRDQFLGRLANVGDEGVGLDLGLLVGALVDLGDLGRDERVALDDPLDANPHDPLKDHRVVVLGQLDDLENASGTADLVQVGLQRILGGGVTLGGDADDRPLMRDGFLDESHRLGSPHIDGNDRSGEQHRVAQRQHRDGVREFGDLFDGLVRRRTHAWGPFRAGHGNTRPPAVNGPDARGVPRRPAIQ